jgi:uncharacterized protein (DUF2252 family)
MPAHNPARKAKGPVHSYRTLDERIARGQAWRETAPVEGHADYTINRKRKDPVTILRAQDDARVQELIPIRYGRMSASAFAFYRGSAAIMAYDLASQKWTPGHTQICGDAHLSNFGVFGSPERDLVFDVNDFDETLPGPFEWDVKRLAASFVLAARDRGFKLQEARTAVRAALKAYRSAIAELAQMGTLEVWYTRIDEKMLLAAIGEMSKQAGVKKKKATKAAEKGFDQARRKTSMKAAQKLTEVVDGKQQFRDEPPLLSRSAFTDEYRRLVDKAFSEYQSTLEADRRRLLQRYHRVDVAVKVVGVGSVGTRAGILLLHGRDDADPLIMQFKQATSSVLEAYLGASTTSQHGARVIEGQRYIQAASDIFLGWVRVGDRDYYLRQLHDMKGSIDTATIDPIGLSAYARLCGATLARAHARGGDVIAIDSYIGTDDSFAEALEEFAHVYADQAEQDYGQLQQAITELKIPVQTGL